MKIKKTRMENKVREENGERRDEKENSEKQIGLQKEKKGARLKIFTASTTGGLHDLPI